MNGLAILNNERFLEKCEGGPVGFCNVWLPFLAEWCIFFEFLTVSWAMAVLWTDGWGFSQMSGGSGIGPGPGALKQQTIGLLHAVAYLRGEASLSRKAVCKYSTALQLHFRVNDLPHTERLFVACSTLDRTECFGDIGEAPLRMSQGTLNCYRNYCEPSLGLFCAFRDTLSGCNSVPCGVLLVCA